MSKLKKIREKLNITQEELSDRSGISIRTIQRIESGNEPKGQTLKLLATTIGIAEHELLDREDSNTKIEPALIDSSLIKIINLSSLPFIIIPFAAIVVPLIIMYFKKKFDPLTKQIVSIQILWLIFAVIVFMLSAIISKWFGIGRQFMPVVMILLVLSNVLIILRNAAEIDKKGKLFFKLNFSII